MQNPGIYASQGLANGGFSDYNSLQLELRRQIPQRLLRPIGLHLLRHEDRFGRHCARTASRRTWTTSALNSTRADRCSTSHMLCDANAIYELPFGIRQANGSTRTASSTRSSAAGRWLSIFAWSSGSPISITSTRGSFNRAGRSDCAGGNPISCNTAFSTMSAEEIKGLLGVHKQADGKNLLDRSESCGPGQRPRRRR